MAVKWFRVALKILVQVVGGGGGVIAICEGVNPRMTAKILIEQFNSAVFSNLLSEFADMEVVWEVSNQEPTIVIKGVCVPLMAMISGSTIFIRWQAMIPFRNRIGLLNWVWLPPRLAQSQK